MIQTKSGPVYTICLDCIPIKDPIPARNEGREECDVCGKVKQLVSFLDYLPRDRRSQEPAAVAARAIIRGMDKPKFKIPRR